MSKSELHRQINDFTSTVITEGGPGWGNPISPQGETTRSWDGGSTVDNYWHSGDSGNPGANWASDGLPAEGDDLVFPAGTARKSNSNNYLTTAGSVTFSDSGYTISGNGLTLASGIDNSINSGTSTWSVNTTLGAAQSFTTASGGTLDIEGNVTNSGYLLTVGGAGATVINGIITGSGGLTKSGTGILTLGAANSYTGGSTVSGGVLKANSAAPNSSTGSGAVAVNTGATLGGRGKVGRVVLESGSTIDPGDGGVGSLATGNGLWKSGAVYHWEINDANGSFGTDPGWDNLAINGGLDIQATPESPMHINIVSLNGSSAGAAANFNAGSAYRWHIVTVTDSVTNFAADKFNVNTSALQNFAGGGDFSIELAAGGHGLDLVFTPHACAAGEVTASWTTTTSPARAILITITDPYGLSSVKGTRLINVTMTGTAYGSGDVVLASDFSMSQDFPVALPTGTVKVVAKGTVINNTLRASCNAIAYDLCNNYSGTIDPVITRLAMEGRDAVMQSFGNIPSAEHYVNIQNDWPGLTRISLLVNERLFVVGPLSDGQSMTLDIAKAMIPGEENTVVLLGEGITGASAIITIGDCPTGEPSAWNEAVALRYERVGDAMRLSWSEAGTGFVLQHREGLGSGNWSDWPEAPEYVNGRYVVDLPPSASTHFFRLYKD